MKGRWYMGRVCVDYGEPRVPIQVHRWGRDEKPTLPDALVRLASAEYNRQGHEQSHEQLAARGGLSDIEIITLLADALEHERRRRGSIVGEADDTFVPAGPYGDMTAPLGLNDLSSAIDAARPLALSEPATEAKPVSAAEKLELALRPFLDDDTAVSVAAWIVQNPEAAEDAAHQHYVGHDCNADSPATEADDG